MSGRKIFKLVAIAAVSYSLICVSYFIFSSASAHYPQLARFQRYISPSVLVFWQDAEFYSNPPLFSEVMVDSQNQLASETIEDFDDVDIWVIILQNLDDVDKLPIAENLGVSRKKMRDFDEVNYYKTKSSAFQIRFHILPLYVRNREVIVVNSNLFVSSYRNDCIDDIMYLIIIDGQRDAIMERCKLEGVVG